MALTDERKKISVPNHPEAILTFWKKKARAELNANGKTYDGFGIGTKPKAILWALKHLK